MILKCDAKLSLTLKKIIHYFKFNLYSLFFLEAHMYIHNNTHKKKFQEDFPESFPLKQ